MFIVTSLLTGCWDSAELNKLAFVTALGFDKAGDDIVLTAQVLNPRAIAAQKPINEAPVIVYTEKGKSAIEIIRRMSTRAPRRLKGTHMQSIIFGEEFAENGISEVVDFLLRHYQTSPDLYFAIAQGTTASNVLTNLSKLENIPSAEINSALEISSKIWAATKSTKLLELADLMSGNEKCPVIPGINISKEPPAKSMDDMKTAVDDPINFDKNGVIKKDRLVGWLNEDESKGYNYINGNVQNTVGYVDSKETGRVTMFSRITKKTTKIIFTDNKPSVAVNINMSATIENISSGFDITKQENLNILEKLSEEKIKKLCEKSIAKAKDLKSDIFGFGNEIHISNPEYWKTVESTWNDSGFIDLPVTITVKFKIVGTDSIGKSILSEEK